MSAEAGNGVLGSVSRCRLNVIAVCPEVLVYMCRDVGVRIGMLMSVQRYWCRCRGVRIGMLMSVQRYRCQCGGVGICAEVLVSLFRVVGVYAEVLVSV